MGKIIDSVEVLNEALTFLATVDKVALDIETTGLNVRRDRIIGIGFGTEVRGYYLPIYTYDTETSTLLRNRISNDQVLDVLGALRHKSLLCHNAAFDLVFIKNVYQIDLIPALHADTMLLKHTCDEEFPFGLKEIATKLFGTDVKKEKEEMQESIKANGGTLKEYYKADTGILGRYCIADCALTFRIYNHYQNELIKQGLHDFYYTTEVLPLYKEVVIPMEQAGIRLDVMRIHQTLVEINQVLVDLEQGILTSITPHLGLFERWFLNKDYPLTTFSNKRPSAWTRKYSSQYDAWRAENEGFMFNLQSKHHLKKLFFDTLKETPLSRTPTGQPQVDEEFLETMGKKWGWAADLITFNKLNKLKGTYIERMMDESENYKLYPSFMCHRTSSGRLAGDMQQLPRPLEAGQASELVVKYTNRIREFIICNLDNVLVSADYKQLEPTIFAHTSGDAALQQIFKDGTDFYTEIAKRTEGLQDVSKAQRQKAKAYALGIAYGMTGYKLQFEIGVPKEEAEELVSKYLNAFPELAEWMYESQRAAYFTGKSITQTGRMRHLDQAKTLYEKYGPCILHDLELWKVYNQSPALYAQAKADRRVFKNLLNNAINHQVQGLAASIMNMSAIKINRLLRGAGLRTKLIMQVHDELVYEVPKSELETVLPIIKDSMENIMQLSVPLRVEPQIGENYRQCK